MLNAADLAKVKVLAQAIDAAITKTNLPTFKSQNTPKIAPKAQIQNKLKHDEISLSLAAMGEQLLALLPKTVITDEVVIALLSDTVTADIARAAITNEQLYQWVAELVGHDQTQCDIAEMRLLLFFNSGVALDRFMALHDEIKALKGRGTAQQTDTKLMTLTIEITAFNRHFAEKVTAARIALGWSKNLLAAEIGEAVHYVTQIEAGQITCSIGECVTLCNALKLDAYQVITAIEKELAALPSQAAIK